MQKSSSSDRGDAATAKWSLALVEAAIADCRQTDHQSTPEISDPGIDHHSIFPPSNIHFDEGSGGGGKKDEKEKKGEQ